LPPVSPTQSLGQGQTQGQGHRRTASQPQPMPINKSHVQNVSSIGSTFTAGSPPRSPVGPNTMGYDGQSILTSSGRVHGHGRSGSITSGGAGPASSILSSSPPAPTNAGWYMSTGVLPSVLAAPAPAPAAAAPPAEDPSRTRKYDSIYRATGLAAKPSPATVPPQPQPQPQTQPQAQLQLPAQNQSALGSSDLTRNSTMKTARTDLTQPSVYSQADTYRTNAVPFGTAAPSVANRQMYPASATQQQPLQARQPNLSASSPPSQSQYQSQQIPTSALPLSAAIANAGTAAQHRRNASGGSGRRVPAPDADRDGSNNAAAAREYDPRSGESRFTEQMDVVGRQSDDTDRVPLAPVSAAPFSSNRSNLHPAGGDSGRKPLPVPDTMQQQQQDSQSPVHAALSSYNRGPLAALPAERGEDLPASEIAKQRELLPASVARREGEGVPSADAVRNNAPLATGGTDRDVFLTPEDESPRALNADDAPTREYREPLQSQVPIPAVRQSPAAAAAAAAAPTPAPAVLASPPASPSGPRAMPKELEQSRIPAPALAPGAAAPRNLETTRTPTYGPDQHTSRVAEPRIIGSTTRRYQDTPAPAISYAAPSASAFSRQQQHQQHSQRPDISSGIGNIGSSIPHYMFVRYEAEVCQECVESDQRMWALNHGGERWRYDYADPDEEAPIASDDPNTTKTGRRDFSDKVSLLPSSHSRAEGGTGVIGGVNGGPCQCAECLKNREAVKYAAENGLIEEVFGGQRHPLSETIETITYTTIVRAPIIEETVETIWCEEPNCAQCLQKDAEYREAELRRLGDSVPGMVVHETEGSGAYEEAYGARDLWGLTAEDDATGAREGESVGEDKKRMLGLLLSRAGNPRQEGLRGFQSRSEGKLVVGEEVLQPGFAGMDDGKLRKAESGTASREAEGGYSIDGSTGAHGHAAGQGHGCAACEEEGIGYGKLKQKLLGQWREEDRSYRPVSAKDLETRYSGTA